MMRRLAAIFRALAEGYRRDAEYYAETRQGRARTYALGQAAAWQTAAACLDTPGSRPPETPTHETGEVDYDQTPGSRITGMVWGPDDPDPSDFEDPEVWDHAARS